MIILVLWSTKPVVHLYRYSHSDWWGWYRCRPAWWISWKSPRCRLQPYLRLQTHNSHIISHNKTMFPKKPTHEFGTKWQRVAIGLLGHTRKSYTDSGNSLLSTTMKFGWRCLLISPTPPRRNPTQVSWKSEEQNEGSEPARQCKYEEEDCLSIDLWLTSSPMTARSLPLPAECIDIFAVYGSCC